MLETALIISAVTAGNPAIPQCQTPEAWRGLIAIHKPGSDMRHFAGDAAHEFMDAFNSTGVKTNFRADEVLIFSHPHFIRKLVVMFENGCLSNVAQLMPETLAEMLGKAFPEI